MGLALTGMGVLESSLPKKTAMYRAQRLIREEDDVHYNVYWARLESYLTQLKELNSSSFHVHLQKDTTTNRFLRYFVGVIMMKELLLKIGLGFYGLDSCHVLFHICKGMQLHILASRTGYNACIVCCI